MMHAPRTLQGAEVAIDRDLVKGILILLVIADHNDFIRILFKDEFKPLTLHVLGFFFLALPGTVHAGRMGSLYADRAVRYGVPFILFYGAYSLMYHLLGRPTVDNDMLAVALDVLSGALIGSFALVKQGAGAAFLWFLPAFLGFFLLANMMWRLQGQSRTAAFVMLWVAHLFIGALPHFVAIHVPLGLAIGAYILPLALLCKSLEGIAAQTGFSIPGMILLGGASLGAYAYLVGSGVNIEVGALDVPVLLQEPDVLLVHDIAVTTGFLVLLAIARGEWRGTAILRIVGKHSLLIYLLHPAIFFILRKIVDIGYPGFAIVEGRRWEHAGMALASVLLTAAVSLAVARPIGRHPLLAGLVMPRDVKHWSQSLQSIMWHLKSFRKGSQS